MSVANGLLASINLLKPAFHTALFSETVLSELRSLSSVLPPVHRAGFECRLDVNSNQIDLQQGFIPTSWEMRAVAQFAEARKVGETGALLEAWTIVERIARETLEPNSVLARSMAEMWLEFDVVPGSELTANEKFKKLAPSVFITTTPQAAPAAELIDRLLPPADVAQIQPLIAEWSQVADSFGASIRNLGVMLGRSPAGVRIHVSKLPFRHFGSFLRSIAWPGETNAINDLSRELFDFVDEVVLCFDVVSLPSGARLLPRLGLEGFFTQKSGLDPRWEPLLNALVDRGLADVVKALAVQRWPGAFTPLNAADSWPEDLIIRSFTRPQSVFGHFERRLSHVKFSYAEGQRTSAKMYFGFGHLWSDIRVNAWGVATEIKGDAATGGTTTDSDVRSRVEVSRTQFGTATSTERASREITNAIAAAERFILSRRNQGGRWRDFYDLGRAAEHDVRVTGYASDEWVSAYIATMLAESDNISAVQAARDTWSLLSQRRNATLGWGYHAQLPPDADSTTWALKLARAVGHVPDNRTLAAHKFLLDQTRSDGGVMCYRVEDCESIATFLRMKGPYDGWCTSHTCVTAAVASLGLDERHLSHVRATQQPDGRWKGHWWDDDEYTTSLATSVLLATGLESDRCQVARAAEWAARRVQLSGAVFSNALDDDSAFATALAISILVSGNFHGTQTDVIVRAKNWLLNQQREDGSFTPSARLRVPAPSAVDPLENPATTLSYLDRDALYTTATVYSALGKTLRNFGT